MNNGLKLPIGMNIHRVYLNEDDTVIVFDELYGSEEVTKRVIFTTEYNITSNTYIQDIIGIKNLINPRKFGGEEFINAVNNIDLEDYSTSKGEIKLTKSLDGNLFSK